MHLDFAMSALRRRRTKIPSDYETFHKPFNRLKQLIFIM